MPAQSFHKPAHIGLQCGHEYSTSCFKMLRKLLQIDLVSLATGRPQSFFHAQIRNKLPHRPRVPRNLTLLPHSPIIRAPTHLRSLTVHPVPT